MKPPLKTIASFHITVNIYETILNMKKGSILCFVTFHAVYCGGKVIPSKHIKNTTQQN